MCLSGVVVPSLVAVWLLAMRSVGPRVGAHSRNVLSLDIKAVALVVRHGERFGASGCGVGGREVAVVVS
jgi:hypothetical protein